MMKFGVVVLLPALITSSGDDQVLVQLVKAPAVKGNASHNVSVKGNASHNATVKGNASHNVTVKGSASQNATVKGNASHNVSIKGNASHNVSMNANATHNASLKANATHKVTNNATQNLTGNASHNVSLKVNATHNATNNANLWAGSGLVDRIANALEPRVLSKDCNGFTDQGNGGAYYRWCNKVLDQAVEHHKQDPQLVGLSYGIFTWDPWSRYLANDYNISTKLYDCYATKPFNGIHAKYNIPYERNNVCVDGAARVDKDGRKFESFIDHLNTRPRRGTLVKMDVEGSEWAALKSVSDEDLKKIDLLDMEIHFCKSMDGMKPHEKRAEMEDRVKTLERLTRLFQVTGRDPAAPNDPDYTEANKKKGRGHDGDYLNRTDDEICGDSMYPGPKGGRHHAGMLSVSYVNRDRLAGVM
jgi:hypothetical protein